MNPRKPSAPAQKPESLDFPIKYGGKNWVLRFGYRASSRLKDHWGLHTDEPDVVPRLTGDQKLAERMGFIELEDIPVMLWACLRSNHPDLTIQDVEELVDEFGVNALQPVLAKVLAAALPPDEAGAKKKTLTPTR